MQCRRIAGALINPYKSRRRMPRATQVSDIGDEPVVLWSLTMAEMIDDFSCGYCKQCIRVKTLKMTGRSNEHNIECAYKHILEYFSPKGGELDVFGDLGKKPSPSPPASIGSCGSSCRWLNPSASPLSSSSLSSKHDSFEDSYVEHLDPNIRIIRKRVKFTKKIKKKRAEERKVPV